MPFRTSKLAVGFFCFDRWRSQIYPLFKQWSFSWPWLAKSAYLNSSIDSRHAVKLSAGCCCFAGRKLLEIWMQGSLFQIDQGRLIERSSMNCDVKLVAEATAWCHRSYENPSTSDYLATRLCLSLSFLWSSWWPTMSTSFAHVLRVDYLLVVTCHYPAPCDLRCSYWRRVCSSPELGCAMKSARGYFEAAAIAFDFWCRQATSNQSGQLHA